MIVYEHEHGDTILESAERAVKLANAVGHTVQLRNNDTRITIHTFTDPRAIVEQWGPTRGEYDRLARENGEQRNIIGVHEETIRTQSKLIASLRESIAEVRRTNGYLNDKLEEKTAEHRAFANAALSGLSAFGCTPEKGYAKDGGVGLLVVDFCRAKKKMADLQERADDCQRKSEALERILALAAEATLLTEATVEIGTLAAVALGQPEAFSRDLLDASITDNTPEPPRVPYCGRCECYHYYGNCV